VSAHVSEHVPTLQYLPAVQDVEQPPQLRGSLTVVTQLPLHGVCPAPQLS
jgi:hypothetical protein